MVQVQCFPVGAVYSKGHHVSMPSGLISVFALVFDLPPQDAARVSLAGVWPSAVASLHFYTNILSISATWLDLNLMRIA